MTDLETREAFLRAIFYSPGDDTPRLVYADWLEERGEDVLAGFIRWGCHERRSGAFDNTGVVQIAPDIGVPPGAFAALALGLFAGDVIEVTADELSDPDAFRVRAATRNPEWFAATALKVTGGRITDARPFDTLFTVPATRQVTRLDLSGIHEPIPGVVTDESGSVTSTEYDYHVRPVITHAGVAALARHRGAHRLTDLDLTYNDLGNDAARALIRSPFLDNLRSLNLMEGNRLLRGRVWQDIIEHFGEDVVS